tara:strand:+ start:71272 stop:72252 length:981 start_codon:yes stop_codon:yes gene_type:complete
MLSWSQDTVNNSIGIKGTASTKPENSAWGIPMIQSTNDPNIFTAKCTLLAGGDLKFHSDRDGDPNKHFWFYAPEANTPILSASTYVVGKHGVALNNKWIVGENEEGLYEIIINTSLQTISIAPTAPIAAIAGSATSIGWDFKGLPFTPTSDPNILTWTGNLSEGGEFKINLTTGEWNDDYWFTAPSDKTPIITNGITIANADAIRTINNVPSDHKWFVPVGQGGEYKVEVNVATDKITIYDSESLGVATNLMEEKIAIYPNPVANTLSFDTALKVTNVSIFSTLGSSISEQKVMNNSIDVSNLKSGVYFVVFEKDGVKTTSRFVKK